MDNLIKLTCNGTTATISPVGAQLKSLCVNGKEYIWRGDPAVWKDSAPVLFPICSGMKDNEYLYEGKTYHMPNHGYVIDKVFAVESRSDNSVTFLHCSDEQTKVMFPFDYEFRVTFTLYDAKLDVRFEVINLSEKTMYFSIGAHEGYALPEGLENYDIVFDQNETLYAYVLEGPILSDERNCVLENGNVLPLKNEYFDIDALIFKELKSRSVIIHAKNDERNIKLNFEGFDYFLIWSIPGNDFVCLEPWCGITDNVNHDKNIKTKEGINPLEPHKTFVRNHSLEIL